MKIREPVDESNQCPPRVVNILARISNLDDMNEYYRSYPPHIGRAFEEHLLFGGQCIIQAYLAAKLARPNQPIKRIDTVFYVGGSAEEPVDYHVKDTQKSSTHLLIETRQKKKLLNCINVRYSPLEQHNQARLRPMKNDFLNDIPRPSDCLPLRESLERVYLEDWFKKNGNSVFLNKTYEAWRICEIRPVDPYFCSGQSNEVKPVAAWFRLRDNLQSMPIREKTIVPLLISDYIVALPTAIAYDQKRVLVSSMATLTHSVTFHSDNYDPYGHFLVVENVDHIQGTSLLNGYVYAENRTLVLSFKQQNLFQLTDKNSRLVPSL